MHCAAHYRPPSLRICFGLLLCPRPNRAVAWEFPWARRGEAREAEQRGQRRPSERRESAQQVEKRGRRPVQSPRRWRLLFEILVRPGARGPGQRRGGGGGGDLAAARYYYLVIVSTGAIAEINPPSKQLLYVVAI